MHMETQFEVNWEKIMRERERIWVKIIYFNFSLLGD